MAEGHSNVRWARQLRALVDEEIVTAELPGPRAERAAGLRGGRLTGVESRGKHLLLHFSSGETLHCHAMMWGTWRLGPPGLAPARAAGALRFRLVTARHEAQLYSAPLVELLTEAELAAHPRLAALGPDILAAAFDREEAERRLRAAGETPLGVALLDQTRLAGVGNIFKAEALFLARLDPRRPTGELDAAAFARLWDRLVPIMREGAARRGRVVTLPEALRRRGESYWVYQRGGRACWVCGGAVGSFPQGKPPRRTWWCPTCQAGEAAAAAPSAAPARAESAPSRPGRPLSLNLELPF